MAKKTYPARFVVTTSVVCALLGVAFGYLAFSGASPDRHTADPRTLPSASLPPPVELAVGETGTTDTGSTVTVLGWAQGAPGWPPPGEGSEYSKAWVRFCSGEGVPSFGIRQIPLFFNVIDAAGVSDHAIVSKRYEPDELNTYLTGVLNPGTCATGSVVFNTPVDTPPVKIRFTGVNRFDWDIAEYSTGEPIPLPSISPGLSPAPVAAPTS